MAFISGSSVYLRTSEELYPSLAFDANIEAPVQLIEVESDGSSNRVEVTQVLIERYIENDFGRLNRETSVAEAASPPGQDTIKMFWSRRIGEYNGDMTPIPISRELFACVAPFARIPSIYPQLLINKTATCVFTTPQLPTEVSARLSPSAIRKEHLSFVIHSIPGAMNHICIGASFTYHFPTRHMYIYMHGLASRNYDYFATLVETSTTLSTSLLIPSLIIQFNLEQRLKALNMWQDKVYWNERKLGIRFDHHDNPDPIGIDYTKLSKDLNAANINLAYVLWSCKNTVRQLDFVDQVAKRYRAQAGKNGVANEQAAEIEQLLLDTHAHLRSWNHGLSDRAEYLSKRAQALVQTVYSGIAQRDSAISLRLASTSTNLAETSQQVAVSTSRDSAVMRVIAAITVFFLPATFTATFFSTTFFSFNENLDGKVYSGWLWLYFVVTVVLTAVVVVGTWILWKVKEREILERAARQVGSEKQLCVDMPVAQQPPVLVAAMQNYMQQEIGARTTAKANGGS